nr:hypothetical protein [uncultured Fluviicola sp.]
MIKRLLIVSCLPFYGYTQNFVINPSFEKVNVIPLLFNSNGSLIGEEMHWWEANNATIDLFSTRNMNCVIADSIIMKPFHGDNYLGAIVSEPGIINYSEILQGELINPLKKGKEYLIGAYLRFGTVSNYKSSDYSFGFSRKKQFEKWFFNRFAVHKSLNKIPADSISDQWKFISSVYQAKGNEKYVVLGNLRRRINIPNTTKANPEASKYKHTAGGIKHAYIDIDDVFLIEIPENYDSIKKGSFSFDSNQKLSLVPQRGDSIVLNFKGFKKDEWKLNDSLTLNKVVDYLKANPFITVELILPEDMGTTMSQLNKLRMRRDQTLELYFEKKGISYNRIHLKWNESPAVNNRIIMKIHDILFR